jgi:hypothetical protein
VSCDINNTSLLTVAAFKVTVIIFVIVCGCFRLNLDSWKIPREVVDKLAKGYGVGDFFRMDLKA